MSNDVEEIAQYVDEEYYFNRYDDVRASGMAAPYHYLHFGWREMRDPSPDFSTKSYLNDFPDLLDKGINPLLHYVRFSGEAQVNIKSKMSNKEIAYKSAFDEDYYIGMNPDIDLKTETAFEHFNNVGWREGRNPSAEFSVEFYLRMNKDIADSGQNPFRHFVLFGKDEGRLGLPYESAVRLKIFQPLVSAIIPNFNHARYLGQRLDSVLNQNYRNLEIIILDDHSTDESDEIIEEYKSAYPGLIRYIRNDINSGNVFSQWKKGYEAARGDLVWICESDDFCELNFLTKLVVQP